MLSARVGLDTSTTPRSRYVVLICSGSCRPNELYVSTGFNNIIIKLFIIITII